MGSQGRMTEYERRRLENIKRNDEMLAALKVRSKLNDLSAASTKRQSAQSKSYKRSPVKKAKTETPVVLRQSLRTRGAPPDPATANGLDDDVDIEKQIKKSPKMNANSVPNKSPREQGPLAMKDAYRGDDGFDNNLVKILSGFSREVPLNENNAVPDDSIDSLVKNEGSETSKTGKEGWVSVDVKSENVACVKTEASETSKTGKEVSGLGDVNRLPLKSETVARVKTEGSEASNTEKKVWGSVDVNRLQLKSENVARVVPGRIMSLKFFPTRDMQMVAVGNKFGDVGFWHVNDKEEDGDGIYLYHPHSGPVSGILIDPSSICKMYSSCYDGFIRLMDVEKGVFDMVYYSEYCIYSMSLNPRDSKSLYFAEGRGGVHKWDVRAGKSCLSFDLHEDRINTIHFNPENENLMATSSTDGTACIWDLRLINTTPLTTVGHKRAVHSAYFSPSGKFLATTSLDDKVGLSSGANYEHTYMVNHNNQTGRWISTFRGVWGWDDSSICIGNMKRGVDIISVPAKRVVTTLQSDLVSAIPCRFDAHPYDVGMLASATSGGQVYIWTPL